MAEFANVLLKFWPLVSTGVVFIFVLGGMWVKIMSTVKANSKLFDKTDALEKFQSGQENENRNVKDQIKTMTEFFMRSVEDAAKRQGEIVTRIDRLMEKK